MNLDPISGIPGLLESPEPSSWAYENLALVGEGHHAMVYAHPHDEGLVIRVACFPEGFFGYAVPSGDEDASVHLPRYSAMALIDDTLVAACERIARIDDEDIEASGWVEVARVLLEGGEESVHPDALAAFRAAQPGFEEFIRTSPHRLSDLRDGNWMLRGRHLVLNDPVSMMTPARAMQIEADFRIERPREMAP